MYKNNHYGLMLAIMVAADLQGIFEECRDASESIVEELLQRVVVFLTQPVDPHATFEFEKDLERLLREMGRRIVEVVYNRLESERPESLPKRFVDQQQEYSRRTRRRTTVAGSARCLAP